ncbi:tRNA 2-selenouridine(34) synthase MnmH [Octadecabacter sp. R77987]|uniref:tRNA 2-selenouridine(34) synthase MnmH n=1 Tax=Octadecabacter sp. R77987 TaxID=3093874 RepID=UPI00366EA5B6
MPVTFDTLAALLDHGYDAVIDVRSPSEFAQDHLPGAINLPVLSDSERAEVGTIYKQVSAFDARKRGAALVSRNAANHIAGPLKDFDGSWRPLVYCWRGGQRSGSFTSVLQQIGWRADVLQGGYQTYRRLVHAAMYDVALPHRLVLLDGNTGTAKTDILGRLAALDVQTIDLEGLAGHRGSLLGDMPEGQPSQKQFESALATTLVALDPNRITVIEAESSKIGRRVIPPTVWAQMIVAPRIQIEAPLDARAAWLVEAYADVINDHARLRAKLDYLRRHRGHAVVDRWVELLDRGDNQSLAADLIAEHYDPAYAKSRASHGHDVLAVLHSETLASGGRDALAAQVKQVLAHL